MKSNVTVSSDKIFGLEVDLIKLLLLPLVLTIVGIVMALLIILPKVEEINTTWMGMKKNQQREKQLLAQRSYYLSLDEEELQKNANLISRALLKENNAYYLVGIIRSIATKYQYTVQSFSVTIGELGAKTDNKNSEFAQIPVTLSLIGPEGKFLELIKGLEKSLPLLALSHYEQRNTTSGLTELSLAVSSYYLQGKGDLDLAKLGATELTLKPEEAKLIEDLANYQVVELASGLMTDEEKSFTKYERNDPFSF